MALWAVACLLVLLLYRALYVSLWRPLRIQRCLRAQGINGPSYRFPYGNLRDLSAMDSRAAQASSPLPHITHDIVPRVLPNFSLWSKQYGKVFFYWLGWNARLIVFDPQLNKEILLNKSGQYQQPIRSVLMRNIMAKGLVNLEGKQWVKHRKIVSPAFFPEKLKGMIPVFVRLAGAMLEKWRLDLESSTHKEIDACKEFRALTADIISHTGFGSSYAEGKKVFLLQTEQLSLFGKGGILDFIPGTRFLPTATNWQQWKKKKQITTILEQIIRRRLSLPGKEYGSDLLGLMLSSCKDEDQRNLAMSFDEIIDECKTFYFAGHETTSRLLTWTVMLLANHPEWQDSAREEVFSLFGNYPPNADSMNDLKIVGMILNESLRLYPPATGVFRKASRDAMLGDILIPKGTGIFIPSLALHVDPQLWGANALEFNPLRFANGVTKACADPSAFMPFGGGPRICVGQNFAILEAKVVLCMILQKFRFSLSPAYRHSPTLVLTLQPEHGMQILVEPLEV